jgi:hypothetical protein
VTKKHQLPTMLILAAIAAILLLIIIILNNQSTQVTKNERLLVGSLFIIISLGGIYSAFRPGRLKRLFQKPAIKKTPKKTKSIISLAGHHPECKPFKNHSFQYKNTEFCTGCYGLAVGSIIAIFTTCVYLLSNILFSIEYSITLLSAGFTLILINYIETIWYHNTILAHLISNSLLIIGFLFIVISTTEITGEASYGITAIVFSVLWLDVRIHLSKYKHRRICQLCPKDCVYFN